MYGLVVTRSAEARALPGKHIAPQVRTEISAAPLSVQFLALWWSVLAQSGHFQPIFRGLVSEVSSSGGGLPGRPKARKSRGRSSFLHHIFCRW
jgi:hypothetical protein